jgi:hypothetical protein
VVDLPTVPDRIVTSTAPTSSVSRSDITGSTNLMAKAIGDVADAQMDIATRQAKEQAATDLQQQKVTLNADGSVSVANPTNSLIFGRAVEQYHAAVQAGTIAQHSNVISQEMNDIHQQYPTDPAAFKTAADAWKARYLQDHGGGQVGEAISQQADQVQSQHQMAITNAAGTNDLKQKDSSLSANQTSARNDVMAMLRGGADLNDPAVQGKIAQYDATTEARATNPLFGYSQEQAKLDRDTFHSEAGANRFLYKNDQVYRDTGPNGGKNAALESAKDILTNPGYNLSPEQRDQFYHKAVGEIRTNEAIRKQDIGEARAADNELRLQFASGFGVSSDDVEHVAQAHIAAGDPGGAAALRASFLRKPLVDDHGNQPLATQTQQLNALQGMNAVHGDVQALIAKGYSPQAAAAIGSHIVHESGGNSGSVNPNDAGTGPSAGLAQFHAERLTALKSYAASVGKPWSDHATQLDFIDRELHTTETGTLAKLQAAKTPEEASAAFYDYERPAGWKPGDATGTRDYASRLGLARAIFDGKPSDMSMGPAGSAWLIAHRQYAVNDAAMTQWKTIMSDYNKEGTRPATQTVTDIVNAAHAARNGALLDTINADSQRMNISGESGQQTLPQQHAQNADMAAAGQRGDLPPAMAAIQKDLQRRTDAITSGLKDNPIATAATNLSNQIKPQPPVDWSSDQSAATSLQARGKIAQIAERQWRPGGALSALDAPDVAQVQGMLANPDPAVKGRVFNALSTLPEDVRNATLAKIGSGRPDLMVSVAAGSMMKSAPDIGASIIRGQAAIAMDKGYVPSKGSEAAAFDQKFDEQIPASTFSLAARTDASGPYAVAQGMVKARYADLSAQSADTTGKPNPERLTQAVNDVTGGILDYNGGKLIAPVRFMPQATFDRTMYGLTDADLAGVSTLNGQPVGANYLRDSATLESAGDGRYYVKLGNDPLKPVYAFTGANTESPKPFLLDLRNRPLGVAPPAMAMVQP